MCVCTYFYSEVIQLQPYLKKLGFISFGAPLLKAHSHIASLPAKLSKGGDFSHPLQPPSRVWLAQYESCLLRHSRRRRCRPECYRGLSTVQSKECYLAEEKAVLNQNVAWPLKVSDQSLISKNKEKKKKSNLKNYCFLKFHFAIFANIISAKKMNLSYETTVKSAEVCLTGQEKKN